MKTFPQGHIRQMDMDSLLGASGEPEGGAMIYAHSDRPFIRDVWQATQECMYLQDSHGVRSTEPGVHSTGERRQMWMNGIGRAAPFAPTTLNANVNGLTPCTAAGTRKTGMHIRASLGPRLCPEGCGTRNAGVEDVSSAPAHRCGLSFIEGTYATI